MKQTLITSILLGLMLGVNARAVELSIAHEDSPGAVKLVLGNTTADIYVDAKDIKVVNIAASLLSDDVQRVTGKKPRVINDAAQLGSSAVIVGSIGNSALIDQLIASGKIDVSDVKGQWETYKLQVVSQPIPNVQSALVIVGSDKRGAAYGVFTLSNAIGVSPWYWWADVTPLHQDSLVVKPATVKDGPPSVKYRGIFINDEDWGLQPWAAKTFETDFKDVGPKTYAKVFELLLRLKANYIWPAMHNCTIEFGKVDGNIKAADDWGIVAGASHPEGMNRNNVDWPTLNLGEWRFDTNSAAMINFWEEWAKKRGPYEAVWTIGMRGVHDSPMLPTNAPMETKVKLLEGALGAQRDLLKKYVNPDVTKIAQIFCPYKEALGQYRAGLQVPDDVTICWTEDNFGYIRQLSNPTEEKRSGHSGVYYHISYLGSPFSYVWLNTTPPALIWEEMSKAYAYGADRVWVLNVGDIKPGEIGIDFWTKLGWNINSYPRENLPNFLVDWATGIFGNSQAKDIAAVMDKYYRFGYARKPESLQRNPAAFSTENYDEATTRLADYDQLVRTAEAINQKLPAERKDAYYELVLYPVKMAAMTNHAFVGSALNKFYTQQNGAKANTYADDVEQSIKTIDSETAYYNDDLVGGKWKNIMTAKGTTSPTYGFRWPQVTRVETNNVKPHVALITNTIVSVAPRTSFVEQEGAISIEAEHFDRNIEKSGAKWEVIPGLGRTGDSVSVFPVTVASIDKPEDIVAKAPTMEYDMTTTTNVSDVDITVYCLPTRRINDVRGLRYAIAVDNETPQVVDYNMLNEDQNWQQAVMRDACINVTKHKLGAPGKHTLKIYMVDPGVVMDKIVVNLGGVKESYLGPPETLVK